MANKFRQLTLLLWKNFILQLRRPIGTAVEILLPIGFVALLIIARIQLKDEEICFSTFKPVTLPEVKSYPMLPMRISYYPQNTYTDAIMGRAHSFFDYINFTSTNENGQSYAGESEMADYVSQERSLFQSYGVAAISFDSWKDKKIEYRIRFPHKISARRKSWDTDRTYPPYMGRGPRGSTFYKAFLNIQFLIDTAIIQIQSKIPQQMAVNTLQQFPYPNYTRNVFVDIVRGLMPTIFLIAFIYTAAMIVKELVSEKQQRLKESMKMMGLANWMHWLAWFIKFSIFFFISNIFLTLLIKFGGIWQYTDGGVTMVFLLLYMTATIASLFFLSVLFSKSVLAMLVCGGLWFVTMVPYWTFANGNGDKLDALSKGEKYALCLLPNSCLGLAITVVSKWEGLQLSLDWSTLNKLSSVDENFTMADVFIILIVDIIIYFLLTWYIEAVFPGEFGIARPPWFPFLRSYWCGQRADAEHGDQSNVVHPSPEDFEDEPEGLPVGVAIRDLRKVYKGATGKKVAVDGLTLNMYKDQITSLLGHNGAGKTTTMSILTGLFPPSSGSARIDGRDITTSMDAIRDSLGLCPQHNILFDRLTVREHLDFFCALKGLSKEAAKPEILTMIDDIQLTDKANAASSTLSGGMKRKLSCAIALIGHPRIVFLDEPTSGMDPYARRATWDLLLKYREGKTMVLTTHFMDEADYLGDRIAIMANGQLRCSGSSLFLKKRYGVGYHMTLVKGAAFEANTVHSLITEHVTSAKVVSNAAAEIAYILDHDSVSRFRELFKDLEDNQSKMGIDSFGISLTTLEEVFLKVGENERMVTGGNNEENAMKPTESMENLLTRQGSAVAKDELLSGFSLWSQRFRAMFMKRFLNSMRDKKAVITQIIVPITLVLLGFLLASQSTVTLDDPARLLTLANLKGSKNVDATNGFFADLRMNPNTADAEKMWKFANGQFSGENVPLTDISSKTKAMMQDNRNGNVRFSDADQPQTLAGNYSKCCNYVYNFLNQQCKSNITNTTFTDTCGVTPKTSSFGKCLACLNYQAKPSRGCQMDFKRLTNPSVYFEDHVLHASQASDNINKYFLKTVAGLSIQDAPNRSQIIAWYSNQGFHTIADAYSSANNVLLKHLTDDDAYEINTWNHPLPRNTDEKLESGQGDSFTMNILLTMALCFLSASFVPFIVNEKTSKSKHIQFVSGVDSLSFWAASWCWDMLNFLVPGIIIFILFAAFDLEAYQGELGEVFLCIILYGFAMLPFIYLVSFIFSSALIGYAVTSMLFLVLCLAMFISVTIVRGLLTGLEAEAEIMHGVFSLVPNYILPQVLSDITLNKQRRDTCLKYTNKIKSVEDASREQCKKKYPYQTTTLSWEYPGILSQVVYMIVEGFVYFLLVILVEENFFLGFLFSKSASEPALQAGDEDVDVVAERERVWQVQLNDMKDDPVVIKDITKVYRSAKRPAVDHCSVGVKRGDCFGLLGVNGAGKTTMFGMLTGELPLTSGTAYLDGYDIQKDLRKVQQRIGYCPQFDALVDRMTGREMLCMFAQLRGIPRSKIPQVVDDVIRMLNLVDWADKMCGDYSGGNKRKLSTAMALVGDPAIVFLDEPTSGMDPGARRCLWTTLTGLLQTGTSIVLTSHSMEECEALCSRLVIMVNGQFKCLGSIQHLKSKYGRGFTLSAKVSNQMLPPPAAGASASPVGPSPPYEKVASNQISPVEPASARNVVIENPGYTSPPVAPTTSTGIGGTTTMDSDGAQYNVAYTTQEGGTVLLPMDPQTANMENVKRFIAAQFPSAKLVEDRQGLLQYQIDDSSVPWSLMFGVLEGNAQRLGIVDYSVSQTSLEQVFINFAKKQHSEDDEKKKGLCSCCQCACCVD